MLKIKNSPEFIVLAITIILLCMSVKNASAAATCNVTPAHVSATIILPVTKYGQNYPISRGDIRLKSTQQLIVNNCSFYIGDIKSYSLQGSQQLTLSTDGRGYEAWILPDAGGNSLFSLGVEPSVSTSNDGYFDAIGSAKALWGVSNGPFTTNTSTNALTSKDAAVDIVSLSSWKIPSSGDSGSLVYTLGQAVGKISINAGSNGVTPYYDAVILDSLTVNYVVSSCGIKSKSSLVDFGDITKTNIFYGAVAAKPFNVMLICGDESDQPSPVNITFNSTNGISDAAAGIVKTNLSGIGLQLSWQNSNLPPLVLDQVNHSTLSGLGDYSVMAKPVVIQKSGLMEAGKLDTSITMSIEFQ